MQIYPLHMGMIYIPDAPPGWLKWKFIVFSIGFHDLKFESGFKMFLTVGSKTSFTKEYPV